MTHARTRAVQLTRHGIATIDGTRQRTWAACAERVVKRAGVLQGFDRRAGGRVAILALDSDRDLACCLAVPGAGGVVGPWHLRLAPPERRSLLQDSGTALRLVDEAFQPWLQAVRGPLTTGKHVVVAGAGRTPAGTVNDDASLATAPAVPDVERGGEHVAGLCSTGGTTGLAKGVRLTPETLLSHALNVLASLTRTGERWIYVHAAPMVHMADGSTSGHLTRMASTHVCLPTFDVAARRTTLQAHGITDTCLVPTMVHRLAHVPGVETDDLASLRTMVYGASPMPEAVLAKAIRVFPAWECIQGDRMTDTSPLITMLAGNYQTCAGPYAGKMASAGQAAPSVEGKIVDDQDHEVPSGTVGEIITRGPHVMHGSWHTPAETAQALRGGWMPTGEAGSMDDDGFVSMVDRVKDMIITGGEHVSSVAVEPVMDQHPSVAMCAVIGIPRAAWGEAIHAVVVCTEGRAVTAADLIAHGKERMAGYKCPRRVDIRQAPLPLSGAGKIRTAAWRAPLWAGNTYR